MRPTTRCLVVAALGWAMAVGPGRAASVDQGLALLTAGRIEEATRHYEAQVSRFPSNVEAHVGLGLAHERSGHTRQAREAYERALQIDANDVRALNNLASLLIDTEDDLPKAVLLLSKALALRPGFAAAHDNLGWAHYKLKNFGQAQKRFEQALRCDPRFATAHYHLGLCWLRREDYQRATRHFLVVTRLDPRFARGWISLGLSHQRADRRSEALAAYKQALTLEDRKSPVGREVVRLINALGTVYAGGSDVFAKDPAKLFERYRAPVDSMPEPFSGTRSSRSTSPSGAMPPPPWMRSDAAGGALDASVGALVPRGIPSDPVQAPAAPALSAPEVPPPSRRSEIRESAASASVSESLVKQDLVERHARMAKLYDDNGLIKDAVAAAQTVITLAPWSREATVCRELMTRLEGKEDTDVHARIAGLLRLGQSLHAEHEIEPALLQYEKVLLLNPKHPIAFKALAFLNVRLGKLDVAYDQVQKALALEPGFPEALMIKGHIEARQRRFKESYDTYRRLGELAREGTPLRQYALGMSQKMRRFIELE